MSKSNKYGYAGADIPSQSFGSNKGKFDPAEINELVADNKWTQYGQLEHIETQTVSDVTTVNFTSLQGSEYNVHFLTYSNVSVETGNNGIGMRFRESGTYETASVYKWSQVRVEGSTFSDQKNTGYSRIPLIWYALGTNTGGNGNGYVYFYNLHNSAKYSFITQQSSGWGYASNNGMLFGNGVLPQASTVDGIQFSNYDGNTNINGTFSLYGIRYS